MFGYYNLFSWCKFSSTKPREISQDASQDAIPNPQPINTLSIEAPSNLIFHRLELVSRIEELAGTTQNHFERYYLETLHRFARWAQQLPASQAHHHAHAGGLLDHALDVAVIALQIRRGFLLPPAAAPEEAVLKKDLWTFAVFTLALLHDAAKPAVDQVITVFDNDKSWTWNPWSGAMSDDPRVRWYRVEFTRNRDYRNHERAALLLAPLIVPPEGLAWLASDPKVFSAWLAYATGDNALAGILGDIVSKADTQSVARNLGAESSPRLVATRGSVPLHEKLLYALRHLIDSGEYPLNRNGVGGWRQGDDLWLVSKRMADTLRAHLTLSGHTGIPTENGRIFDALQDHGILVPFEGQAIWKAAVRGDNYSHELTLLRVPIYRIWDDPQTAPPEFSGVIEPLEHGKPDVKTDLTPAAPAPSLTPINPNASAANNLVGDITCPSLSIGQRFLQWVRSGLEQRRILYNEAKARVHVVAEGVLLVSPGIFQDFSAECGEQYDGVQKSFLKLKLHHKTTAGMNIHRYVIEPKQAVISAILLTDPATVFGAIVPHPNPCLRKE